MIQTQSHSSHRAYTVILALLLVGLLADTLTTAIGLSTDPRYEQNPVGIIALSHGPLLTLTLYAALCAVLWGSGRYLAQQGAAGVLRLLSGLLAVVVLVRWAVVVIDVLAMQGVLR